MLLGWCAVRSRADGWVLWGCRLGVLFGVLFGVLLRAHGGHAVLDALWGAVGGVRDGAGGCTIVGMFFAIWGLCWCILSKTANRMEDTFLISGTLRTASRQWAGPAPKPLICARCV